MYQELITAFEKVAFQAIYREFGVSRSPYVFVAPSINRDDETGVHFEEGYFMISSENGLWAAETHIAGIIQMAENIDDIVKAVMGFYMMNDDTTDGDEPTLRRALSKMQRAGLVPLVIDSSTLSIFSSDQTSINPEDTDDFVRDFLQSAEQKPSFHVTKSDEQWLVENIRANERISFSNLDDTTGYIITSHRTSFSC